MQSRFNKVQLKHSQMFKVTMDRSMNVLCSTAVVLEGIKGDKA